MPSKREESFNFYNLQSDRNIPVTRAEDLVLVVGVDRASCGVEPDEPCELDIQRHSTTLRISHSADAHDTHGLRDWDYIWFHVENSTSLYLNVPQLMAQYHRRARHGPRLLTIEGNAAH
jgi:hypothetical protein